VSINLHAVFTDSKNRVVHSLSLYQTPTDVTFMCCGEKGDTPLECIDRYIKWYSGLEYADKEHVDKIKEEIEEWSGDYTLDVYWL